MDFIIDRNKIETERSFVTVCAESQSEYFLTNFIKAACSFI